MDLSAPLWSDLPLEMLEQVLSYLRVPDLCRYRTVCKRWDRLMCDQKFGFVCAQNAAKREASLIAMRYKTWGRRHEGWCFLDVNARRWYVFKEDGQGIRRNFCRGNVTMDGGLVCQYVLNDLGPARISVYNPISQMHREVPTVPLKCMASEGLPELLLVVDNISQSFKIFLFYISANDPHDLNDPFKLIYDSVSNEWKTSTSPFPVDSRSKLLGSYVIFQDYLYIHLYFSLREESPLWRYNLLKDAWENLDVPPRYEFEASRADLVVSANRLFLVTWSTGGGLGFDDGGPWSFQLSELNIPDMTREVLFEMSKADVLERFGAGIENRMIGIPWISAFSFGNSILFMSEFTGVSAAFDVVTRSWDWNFPPNPLEYLPDEPCSWVGEQMNLLLPCTLW
ncbi:hypothetical protein M758_9G182200 [Ceratodon purpureus]|nr:hypothetical protein M758_9G182200 [Ceratodon purpureus]